MDKPTLQSVAEHASVSRQTVSNALNAPHLVRPETLGRVLAAIEELGYRPHGAARQLRTRRSHVLGVRLPPTVDGINGAVLDRFLHALTEQAQLHGYRVMLFTAADDHGEIAQYAELLDTLDLDGFVLASTHRGDPRTRWLSERGVPYVTFGRPWSSPGDDDPDHPWVDVDGFAGTRAATEHLQALGHRRIAFVGWPAGSETGDDRREGWRRAQLAAGVPGDDLLDLAIGVPDAVATGAEAARVLLGRSAPTAFVCASDSLALGVLSVTRGADAGGAGGSPAAAPAVVGFDDTPVARAVGLTSVAQPLTEAAVRALDLVLAQIRSGLDDGAADRQVLLSPSLVVRATSAAPGTPV